MSGSTRMLFDPTSDQGCGFATASQSGGLVVRENNRLYTASLAGAAFVTAGVEEDRMGRWYSERSTVAGALGADCPAAASYREACRRCRRRCRHRRRRLHRIVDRSAPGRAGTRCRCA